MFEAKDVERQEFAYGTTRLLRLMKIGDVFHAEQKSGATWRVFARIDGPNAYNEALDLLCNTNQELAAAIAARIKARGKE